ncbi:TlpA family protein disulfide reductase [Polaribacter sp. MSW13]|uniref:TlpA family protein disulfide reductase n=1 Tax=Polaribacter marinus TaxID=2916838 RepID=A0A9X1VTF1_9FLAO|nr:TlpA disulfide reductase family protein [Polaribacter marinus]MCI2229081.1 TlpA family protein disulfide reductase [Polaribacter marinus]
MKKIIIVFLVFLSSCTFETPTQFSEKALNDKVTSLNGTQSTFKEIINQYKGKKVLIDVWASWCADCFKSLPKVKQLQKDFPDVVYLFLSVDEKSTSWKRAIQRFKIEGEHYNFPKGMKNGDFVDFINLNWIPRYIVVDENGGIKLFKATKSSDKRIVEALNSK